MQTTGLLSFNVLDCIVFFSVSTNINYSLPGIIFTSGVVKTEIALIGGPGKCIKTVESVTIFLSALSNRINHVVAEVSVDFRISRTLASTSPLSYNQLIASDSFYNYCFTSVTGIYFCCSLNVVKTVK